MYFAQQAESIDLNLYLTLLNQIVDEDNKEFISLFDDIILNAYSLATGGITHYQVKNEIYDIVNLLVKSNAEYFKNINPNKIDKTVYRSIQAFLKTMSESNSFYLM